MIDKVQKIREEIENKLEVMQYQVHRKDAYKELKCVLNYIDFLQEEPVSSIWHDASEPPIIDKTFLLVAPNGNSSLCLWGGKQLHSVTIGGGHSVLCKGDIYSYIDDLLNLDNSCNFGKNLQEEPVSEDLEKIVEEIAEPTILNAYGTKELARRLRNTICGTSVSELEEASKNYALNNTPWDDCKDEIQESFKAGAKWQKQQDQSTIELAEDHAMLAGMEKMKEQMMAKAIDGTARPNDNEIWCNLTSNNFKDGDKVKVIVTKED